MSLNVTKSNAGSASKKKPEQREIAKSGPRMAVISGIIDLGIQPQEYQGEKQRDCREFLPILTLLKDKYTDEDGEEHCMVTSPWPIKIKLGEKSNYTKFTKAADPNGEVLEDGVGDLFGLIGRQVFAVMVHTEGKGDAKGITYANCKGIQELPEDFHMEGVEYNEVQFNSQEPDKVVFDSLWDRTQDLITSAVDWDESRFQQDAAKKGDDGVDGEPEGEEYDDIPF